MRDRLLRKNSSLRVSERWPGNILPSLRGIDTSLHAIGVSIRVICTPMHAICASMHLICAPMSAIDTSLRVMHDPLPGMAQLEGQG